ncbi:thioesterase II family protein [Pleionea sp. CnH1-48]|uniref:thioesterase II family protein n=1 Tax=Pleionea sp. CnH1-48 TaxID=2954494 RepID=UPI002097BFA5|nr:thioesterase domain-containing protein [Pleionea sp. CnH1-48]MCO7222741.1 thioesterase domain-containing protein [Pleionea sp. CnH1-48]
MKEKWLATLSHNTQAEQHLLCIPYAGGNAHAFRPWTEYLPPTVALASTLGPGKGARVLEPPCKTVEEIVAGLLPELIPWISSKPYYLFGHSNGALISFELMQELRKRQLPMPEHFFLSASAAPWTREVEESYSQMSDARFKDELKDLNGTPPGILENDELLQLLLPGLKAEFALVEHYDGVNKPALDVKTSVFYGAEDAIEYSQLEAWQEKFSSPLTYHRFEGDHFFLEQQTEEMVNLVTRIMFAPKYATSSAY